MKDERIWYKKESYMNVVLLWANVCNFELEQKIIGFSTVSDSYRYSPLLSLYHFVIDKTKEIAFSL